MQSKIVYDALIRIQYFTSLLQLKILFSDHNHITSTFYLIRTYKDLVSYEQLSIKFLALTDKKAVMRQTEKNLLLF